MKIDKSVNALLMFIAVFMTLITAYYVNEIALSNNTSTEYSKILTLTGLRLSDEVYAYAEKYNESKTPYGYSYEYDFYISNIGKNTINNWKIFMEVPEGTLIENSYDVECSFNSGTDTEIVLNPEHYNVALGHNESIVVGVSFSTKEPFTPEELHFVGYKVHGNEFNLRKKIIVILMLVWLVVFIGFLVTKFNLKNYRERQKNDVKIILQSMNTFISFIDAKDPYTRGHSKRVAMYAAEIAKRMGLSEDEIQNIYYAGLLHDAGKISIPDAVLNKPGKLTDEERALIQNHTVAGGKMLKQLSSIRGIRETALYHHERYDGTGYPEGLKGDSIPLYARIVGVADSYDAMSSNRVYRRHLNKDDIIEEIQKGSGTQFDPEILKYMVDMINDGYVNVVKMETADSDDGVRDFHITESDIPGVYMGY